MIANFFKRSLVITTTGFYIFCIEVAHAEYKLNFPEPATPIARDIYDVHMLTVGVITVIMIIMTVIVLYAVVTFRKDKGYVADQKFHKSWFGHWAWVIVPLIVLSVDLTIANKAQHVLNNMWDAPKKECTKSVQNKDEKCYDMLVKIIGHQWWWEYEYPDLGITVESRFTPKSQSGDNYLRAVDHRFVLPIGKKIRFLQTSADVNHAFWIPELGFKKDAIAGYVTETWTEIKKEGIYRGQCAELCGTWHARMPAVVEALSQEKFDAWVRVKQEEKRQAEAEAMLDKIWAKAELMAKGEAFYNVKCAACHQISGLGLAPAFPPLKGSKVVAGPLEQHLKIVLTGQGIMPSWAAENDLDIAAVITYERNAWGNNGNEIVQPTEVKAARIQVNKPDVTQDTMADNKSVREGDNDDK